jgi:hypothetical protein
MRLGLLGLGAIAAMCACTSAHAQAQTVPVVEAVRQTKIGFNLDTSYDSNISHEDPALAAARGITPEDETATPSVLVDLTYPLGRQAVFLNGQAGYDFHRVNKQLDRERVNLTGGALVVTGRCRSTPYGAYTAAQSDLQDLALGQAKNLMTTVAEGVGITCGAAQGLTGQASYYHQNVTNTATAEKIADHQVDSGSGSFGYGNERLGTLLLTGSYSNQSFPNLITSPGHVGEGYSNELVGISYSKNIGARIRFQGQIGESSLHRENAPVGIPLTVNGANFTFMLDYKMSTQLEFLAQSMRQFQPSNSPGKLFELATTSQVTANYNLGTRFLISLGGIIEDITSNQDTAVAATPTPTQSHSRTVFGSIRYQQSEKASLMLDLRQVQRSTDLSAYDYTDNRATLTLAVSF